MDYEYTWANKWATYGAKTFDELIRQYTQALSRLKAMKKDGIVFDENNVDQDGFSFLHTTNKKLAKKYGFEHFEEE